MAERLLALGSYRFAVDTATYNKLERRSTWRWAKKEVVGSKPLTDYVGPDLEEIQLSGVIYPHYRGGLGQLDAMRAEATKGEPLRLVLGTGADLGLWCLLEVTETQGNIYRRGIPLKIEFQLKLQEYAQ